MKIKYYKIFILILLITITTLTSCSNTKSVIQKGSNEDSFNINVSINYKIKLADKVKTINPNIIKATRQAVFDDECTKSKFMHFNGYSVTKEILIYDVKEKSNNTWEVYYKVISGGIKNTNKDLVTFATVEKEATGSYKGHLLLGGSSNLKLDETY